MLKELGFYRGINLGGWLSQCDYSQERLDHFIEEQDIEKIASWGLDHVRIPVDYNVLERDDGTYREDGFDRIKRAVGWCQKNGLRTVIDLHKTAGFSFDAGEKEAGFFESEQYQERFYRLWERIARCFGRYEGQVALELLNEVTEKRWIEAWNRIVKTCIQRVRQDAPRCPILVGSYWNNAAGALPDLDAPADDRVVYNFHCYDPLPFTHQGAPWVRQLDVQKRMTFEEAALPADYFEQRFAPALETARKHSADLYCGEYGVINRARPEDTVKWFRQIHAAFEKHGISRAAWSYRRMDFGLSDPQLDSVREELIRLL